MTSTSLVSDIYPVPATTLKITAFVQGEYQGLKWPTPLRPDVALLGADSALGGDLSTHGSTARLTMLASGSSHDFASGAGMSELLAAIARHPRDVERASLSLGGSSWAEAVAWHTEPNGARSYVKVIFSVLDRPAMLALMRRTSGIGVQECAARALEQLFGAA